MIRMKSARVLLLILLLMMNLCSCAAPQAAETVPELNQEAPSEETAAPPAQVVALSSSLAEIWLLAGGTLAGTSSDTLERNFEALSDSTVSVGTVKEPSLEAILDLKPDFIILSADISGHTALEQTLIDAEIPYYYAHVETFEDYYQTLEYFCSLTGNSEKLTQNGDEVRAQIETRTANYTPPSPPSTYLLLRVHSSGGKVIAEDHVACDILEDLGAVNIAAQNQSLLSDLSLEAILESNPDFIFVVTMGDETAALQTLEQVFAAQPAWQLLHAVQNERVHILSKELFHYKPNAKWGEAYEALITLLEE